MKLLKEETTHIGFIGKGSFKKKKVIEFKSERAAKMWLTKNAPKYHASGIDSVGYMVKDKWDKYPYTEATVNKDMGKAPTIKKSIWDKLHSDYKSVRNGVHYMMYLDKKSGATIYGPVKIVESIKEAKQSDANIVADQLVNAVDDGYLDRREFISHLSKETSYGKNELGKVFDAWLKMDARERFDMGFSNREMLQWLKKFGIKEGVKKGK